MPLTPTPKKTSVRARRKIRSENIGHEIAFGKSPSQVAAIAYEKERMTADRSKKEIEYDMAKKNCTVDDHRPCELASAVNFAEGISHDYRTSIPPKLAKILDTKKVSENQVRAALEEWRYTLPKSGQQEAKFLMEAVFPPRG